MNATPADDELSVMELRRYTLHPHKRDVLIDVFDREFVETQEAVGMAVVGQFREPSDPDKFVWLRGFRDTASRERGLAAFYGGPTWQAHRNVANATMIDSDNVLLLQRAWPGTGLPFDPRRRAAPDAVAIPQGAVDITVFYLKEPAVPELLAFCRNEMTQVLADNGALTQAWYVTNLSENTFPGLPIRAGEHALVGVGLFANLAILEALNQSGVWAQKIAPTLAPWLSRPCEPHRLVPTARSALHA